MGRTTSAQVEKIIEVESGDDLTPFIETANSLVTDCCSDSGYTSVKLELIERWLAAHFYAQLKPRSQSENVGVGVSYQSAVSLGFNNTHYGQMALRLDTAGGLAQLEATTKEGKGLGIVSVDYLGTDDDDDEDSE